MALLFDAPLVGGISDRMGSPATFTRNGSTATPNRRDALRIWAASDIHMKPADGTMDKPISKFKRAISDANGLGCELAMFNGDLTHYGHTDEYDRLRECLGGLDMPHEAVTGNHEFLGYDGEETHRLRFIDFFGYKERIYGYHVRNFIMLVRLCTEKPNANYGWIRQPQLDWLSATLAAHRDKTTLIFMHHPLKDSVNKSELDPNYAEQTDQLRNIFRQNPQVKLLMSGHTHQQLTDDRQWLLDSSGVQCAGGSSTAYRREYGDDGSRTKTYQMEQSPFVEVYGDRIIVRGRRHEVNLQGWIAEHTLTTSTTYSAPVLIAARDEVLRYSVSLGAPLTIAGKYMPRFHSGSGRSAPATLFRLEGANGVRALQYRPAERTWRLAGGESPLELAVQRFRTHEPIYFAVHQESAGQKLFLRVGDKGRTETACNSVQAPGGTLTSLYVGNGLDGQSGINGWCGVRAWSGALPHDRVVEEWAKMAHW